MRTAKIVSFTMPPSMLKQADNLAKKENRTKSELLREALRRYIIQQEYQDLQRIGMERARKLGIKASDVNRLIHEYRAEKAAKR